MFNNLMSAKCYELQRLAETMEIKIQIKTSAGPGDKPACKIVLLGKEISPANAAKILLMLKETNVTIRKQFWEAFPGL